MGALQKELTNKHAELKSLVSAESVGLQKQIAEAKALLENITIGGLGKEVIGWLWLLGGTLLSALASR